MIVDCHAYAGPGKTWADPEREVNYDLRDVFAHGGIDRYCILPARNETYAEANRGIARLCEQHRGKLIGFAAHSPKREAGQLKRLLTAEVRQMGLRAVRSDGHPTRELMDAARDLRIPLIYYPSGRVQQLGRYYHMLASAYPQVPIVIPHLGQYCSLAWSPHMEALDLARRYPNIYLDTSGIGSLKYLEMAVRELPPHKLLFGSCAPEMDTRVARESVRLAKVNEQVLGSNILRLLEG